MSETPSEAQSEADNSTFEWTADFAISLAGLLQSEAVLWDKSHHDYKKSSAKRDAMKRIGDIFGTSALVVQSKITNLRSQFHREEKRMLQNTNDGAGHYVSKWFLFDHLKFLSNSSVIRSMDQSQGNDAAVLTEEEIVTVNDFDAAQEEEEPEEESAVQKTDKDVIGKNHQARRIENRSRRRAVSASSNHLLEISQSQVRDKEKEEDDCDIFGRLVAKRMRMIENPIVRLVAEQEISACIARKLCEASGISSEKSLPR